MIDLWSFGQDFTWFKYAFSELETSEVLEA